MTDYIKREDAIKALEEDIPITDNPVEVIASAIAALEEQPSADVVEVVRCKDCMHFHYDMPYTVQGIFPVFGHEVCDFWGDGCKTSENGFCSYGEKAEQ